MGNEALAFRHENREPRFAYVRRWIDRTTIVAAFNEGLQRTRTNAVDLIGVDLDGNDLYFTADLLAFGARPSVWIVEYNAKFPPPIRWSIAYDPSHAWRADDYFGASLSSFVDLFAQYGYRLVCCNAHSGTNAFFVREDLSDRFGDVPRDVDVLFCERFYYEYRSFGRGHSPSGRTVERILDTT